MAVSGSSSIDIAAPIATILDAIADLESYPSWSPIHKEVEVLERDDNGRPTKARMSASLMGIADEQVLTYDWNDTGVTWDLLESTQQKAQHAEYRLTETADGTHVDFEMSLDPKIPVPGFLLKKGKKTIIEMATQGLKDQVK
ncbi:SRPBCC family protein [Williamsia phyllosphaerae]|uniref:Cyclase n=1 Tax=Williamsia phyllosphaerae TaxID=885042 RepID=A0ABQ1UAF9_9NOCA|nr:SRPBCC family protein [Williamsia phyllosphaerae]GGF13137.1 cyclase [Williamsia phyllosphaerae]